MSSPPSSSEAASSFELLDEKVQHWIYKQQWQELRGIQKRSITPVLNRSQDLIVAAATAAGKTEAAFLPILTSLRRAPIETGVGALYIAPLKALINDQHQRLDLLCEACGVALTSWHGDIGAEPKRKLLAHPSGILLITPESLESIFVNHGSSVPAIFGALRYVVIDELHAFIGSERGRQMQSLLHRIECAGKTRAMRIGLSATLGEMAPAADFLRPGHGAEVDIIESKDDARTLMVQLRGYVAEPPPSGIEPTPDELLVDGDRLAIAEHIYANLRGSDNLVFANSRRGVEEFADLLRRRCEAERVPTEFFPHHGSLSKALREEVEERLRDPNRPTTAICTSTLELGIDVGSVTCVGQIDAPFSAAALRQRLGRSGRRPEDPSVLRMYVTESGLEPGAAASDELREGLVQSIALIEALIDGWFEPPIDGALHLSTLIQQVLSVIAQLGGARAEEIWTALCGSGPFELDREDFAVLLKGLGARDVIQQAGDGELILAPRGEQIVGHYSFYAAFTTSEEYRLVADGVELGSMPISSPLREDSYLIFGGRRWKIVSIDDDRRVISVVRAAGGKVPRFFGEAGELHDEIRRRMRDIYKRETVPVFLDSKARALLAQARAGFGSLGLSRHQIIPFEGGSAYFPWRGDRVSATLALGIRAAGHHVEMQGLALVIHKLAPLELCRLLLDTFGTDADPDSLWLAGTVENLATEKHHHLLDPDLLLRDCAVARLDVVGAKTAVAELVTEHVDAASIGNDRIEAKADEPTNGAVRLGSPRFVVLDCETTGLHPNGGHQIVELAVLEVDERGAIVGRFSTLLKPQRNLGGSAIHGISAQDLTLAPSFDQVLGEVTDRLRGRVIVAHNARFDRAFLESELARCGIDVTPLPVICTMELASRIGIGGVRRRLEDCRASLGLDSDDSHTALDDAEAAAAIFAAYLERYGNGVAALVRGTLRPAEDWPTDGDRAAPVPRRAVAPAKASSLGELIAQSGPLIGESGLNHEDQGPDESGGNTTAYLEVLERAIEDRRLDATERSDLLATASLLGLPQPAVERVHSEYVDHLIALARRDGEITSRERQDLQSVAVALEIDDLDDRLRDAPNRTVPDIAIAKNSFGGLTVCFTGELVCRYEGERLTRSRAWALAEAAGLIVAPRLTKTVDLLVLADPDSTSEKARKARRYGARLIAETAFWEMISIEVN
jgi:ATP-dependent Lhr-like helicase